jgi:hypothetical protein
MLKTIRHTENGKRAVTQGNNGTHTNRIMHRQFPCTCTFPSDVLSCCILRFWRCAPKWILPHAAPHSLLDVRGTGNKLLGRSGIVHCLATCHFALHNVPGISEWRNLQARGGCQLFNHQQHAGVIYQFTDTNIHWQMGAGVTNTYPTVGCFSQNANSTKFLFMYNLQKTF